MQNIKCILAERVSASLVGSEKSLLFRLPEERSEGQRAQMTQIADVCGARKVFPSTFSRDDPVILAPAVCFVTRR